MLALEDESLEDLEISAEANDAAVRVNSASIYIVLRSESDFSKLEPRLASLLSPLSAGSELLSVFQQLHELNNFVGFQRKTSSQVLKLIALSASKKSILLSHATAALVANVIVLLFSR